MNARAGRGLVAASAAGMLLAACGGGARKPARAGTKANTTSAAVRFSECMRQHGLTNFPDVIPSQGLPILHELNGSVAILVNGVPQPVSSPRLNHAISDCSHYMVEFMGHSVGASVTPGSIQRALAQTAECFRTNGISNYPDPPPLGTRTEMHMSPSGRARGAGINVDSPAFKSAAAKCSSIINRAING